MDTTDYLLRNQANRNRLLAAVERDKNRQFISRDLIEV
jgi:PHD/YefM family antitoxin component YafN of YafNO toxin-antitoxin module